MKNRFKKSSCLTAALSLLLVFQAALPAQAAWLLWEGPPDPVPALYGWYTCSLSAPLFGTKP